MMQGGVIVDTSVLISFFKGTEEHVKAVTKLLQDNRIVVTGIIVAELLQGMKNIKEEDKVSDLLKAICSLELTTELWIKTGKMSLSLRRRGINIPLTDVAIASIAIEHNLSIFTLDKHFEQISDVKIYKSS